VIFLRQVALNFIKCSILEKKYAAGCQYVLLLLHFQGVMNGVRFLGHLGAALVFCNFQTILLYCSYSGVLDCSLTKLN